MNTLDWIKHNEQNGNFGIIIDPTFQWLRIFDTLGDTLIVTSNSYNRLKYSHLTFSSKTIKTKVRIVYDTENINTTITNCWFHVSNPVYFPSKETRIIKSNLHIYRIPFKLTKFEKMLGNPEIKSLYLYNNSKKAIKLDKCKCQECGAFNNVRLKCDHEFCLKCVIQTTNCPICQSKTIIFPKSYKNSKITSLKKLIKSEKKKFIIYSMIKIKGFKGICFHPKIGNPNNVNNIIIFDDNIKQYHKYNVCNDDEKNIYIFEEQGT